MLFSETKQLLKEITEAYPGLIFNEYGLSVWHEHLLDVNLELARFHFKCFREVCAIDRFITISELRNGLGFDKDQERAVN